MKKLVCILSLCMAVLILTSCRQVLPENTYQNENFEDNIVNEPASVEWVASAVSVDLSGLNVYWQSDNLNFAADDEAKLTIYVNASKDNRGEFIFDDGHQWLVLMETSLGSFPLFPRQRVQLGMVSCEVFNSLTNGNADQNFHILITIQQTAGYQIYECVFDNEKQEFRVDTIYNATNINYITNSSFQ